jgi:hypothetical protein
VRAQEFDRKSHSPQNRISRRSHDEETTSRLEMINLTWSILLATFLLGIVSIGVYRAIQKLASSEVYYKYDGSGITKFKSVIRNTMVLRQIFRKIKLKLGLITRPVLGRKAPDVSLVSLADGTTKSLEKDYFTQVRDAPLILNCGSYN